MNMIANSCRVSEFRYADCRRSTSNRRMTVRVHRSQGTCHHCAGEGAEFGRPGAGGIGDG